MFGLGWSELVVVGIVALIVVGPKDLPVMFRHLGKLTAKARSMAREFTRAMDAAADQAGVKEMQNDLRNMANPAAEFKNAATQWAKFDDGDLDADRKATADRIREATAQREAEKSKAEPDASASVNPSQEQRPLEPNNEAPKPARRAATSSGEANEV
ncbi:MAG: Sec-independent protein translocase protein TatB [Pseudomonadota bacterium]